MNTAQAQLGAVLSAGGPGLARLLERTEARLAQVAETHGAALGAHAAGTLAAGGKRLRPVLVFLCQPRLGALEQAPERRAAGREHRSELSLCGIHRRVPAWIAMIPPAVRTQRTSLRPAATIRAASSPGPGKRRTLLGR